MRCTEGDPPVAGIDIEHWLPEGGADIFGFVLPP